MIICLRVRARGGGSRRMGKREDGEGTDEAERERDKRGRERMKGGVEREKEGMRQRASEADRCWHVRRSGNPERTKEV